MAVKNRIATMYPPDNSSMTSAKISPIPVNVTEPTTIPATAVAMAIGTIFLAPLTIP